MGFAVVGGAMISCSFGVAPSALMVLPEAKVVNNMPLACIADNKPMVNILPFGMCQCQANPAVIAATAAALGVPTPAPCIPVTTAPWAPGSPTVMIGGKPALNESCKLTCMYGGVISITNPGQQSIQIP